MNMKILIVILFVSMGTFFCNRENTQVGKELQNSLQDIQVNRDSGQDVKVNAYDTLFCIFDTLSENSRMTYIAKKQSKIDKVLIDYYGKYYTLKDNDSIFKILVACDFSSQADHELVPFYIYVLSEILKNENVDGYVGESLVDMCYLLFRNFPGYFYQYMDFVDKGIKASLMDKILLGVYYNGTDKKTLESLFKQHIKMFPKQRTEIRNLERYLDENSEKYD